MALKITRSADSRVIKAILHRIADVPGGVTVSVADIGGAALKEGTPLAYAVADGMYHVCKTALIVTDAIISAVAYDVAKGSHFKVGDRFATEGANGQLITAIDKTTNADKDVITVGTTLGVVITAASKTVAFQSNAGDKVVKYAPTVIAGQNQDVVASESLFTDAWVLAVVKTGNAPSVNATVTATLKGIHYIV
jgi:hypothetical protein